MRPRRRLSSAMAAGVRAFLPSCRRVIRLQSQSLDHRLRISSRIGFWVHLLFCRWCRRYGRHLRFLRRHLRQHPEELAESSTAHLTPEALESIRRALDEKGH